MQVVGFNFAKISAERFSNFKQGSSINTHIEFLDMQKEKIDMLKDSEAVRITFLFSVDYNEKEPEKEEGGKKENKDKNKDEQNSSLRAGEVSFKGTIILTITKDESKEIFKSWKKKEIPQNIKLPLFNLILRRCSIKSLELEDEIGLPTHVPLPVLKPQQDNQQ